jgi:uncharacterized protein (DUF58 family)
LLARRHDVVAIQVLDPREHDLPVAGLIALTDPETGEHVLVDTGDPDFRSRLWGLAQARQRQLEAVAAHAGIALHRISTDEDLVGALLRIARLRSSWRR